MPIRFRCPVCNKPLSIGSRKAGMQVHCPLCKGDLTVPAASTYFKRSPLEIDDNVAGSLCLVPTALPEGDEQRPLLLPLPPAPLSAEEVPESAPAPPSEAIQTQTDFSIPALTPAPLPVPAPVWAPADEPDVSSWGDLLPGAALVGVLVLLLVVPTAIYLVGQFVSSPEGPKGPALVVQNEGLSVPAPPVVPQPVVNPNPPPEPMPAPKLVKPGEAPAGQGRPHKKRKSQPVAEIPAPEPPPAPPIKVEPPPAPPAPVKVEPPAPQPPVEVKPAAAPPAAVSWADKWRRVRRSVAGDEDLRKELLLATEVALDTPRTPNSTALLLNVAKARPGGGNDLAPLLMAQRPDLAGLRPRRGRDCRLGKDPAENLQVLSRKLRTALEASIPGASRGTLADPRPNPDTLRGRLLNDADKKDWLQPEAIPTLLQLLMPENKNVRLILVELLAQIPGREATEALAARALYDLHPQVRETAVAALKERPAQEYEPALMRGFQYPWQPVADHAAEALVMLDDKKAVPGLVLLLEDRDVSRPFALPMGGSRKMTVVQELVRINHLGNCLLCHAPSFKQTDLVRGRVPIPGQALPAPVTTPQYYEGNQGIFVRADTTYLKQDFSVTQPVEHPGVWPDYQRYDYLVRLRPVTSPELTAWRNNLKKLPSLSPRQDALLFALRELTGKDLGPLPENWKQLLAIARPKQGEEATDAAALDLGADPEAPAGTKDLALSTRKAFAQYLAQLSPADLRAKLKDKNNDLRHAAVLACGLRKDRALVPALMERVHDSDPAIAGAAERTLRDLDPELPVKGASAELSAALADAGQDRQLELVEAYRVGEGPTYNVALARAIPNLAPVPRIKARDALAERLAKAPVKEVRDALHDEDRELRFAAIEAASRKKGWSLVPDLIPLLNDGDARIILFTRDALRQMTGNDLGPEAGAPIDERLRVLTQWQAWWKRQARQ